jgi:hypothetical protein
LLVETALGKIRIQALKDVKGTTLAQFIRFNVAPGGANSCR